MPDPVILDPLITLSSLLVGLFAVATFQLSFNGGAGATVTYTISDGTTTVTGQTTIGANGHATTSVDLSSLHDGTLTVNATETDAFGNTETYAQVTLTKDTVPPAVPTVTLAGGWTTSSATPAFAIANLEPFATFQFYVDGLPYTLGQTIANGSHTVSATQKDAAGNVSPLSSAQSFVVAAVGALSAAFTLNGGGALTSSHAVAIAVTASSPAGIANVQIKVGATVVYNGSLAGATTVTLAGADGAYTVTVTVTDGVGNMSTSSKSVTLDTTGPVVTAALSAPNNTTYYDVGAAITVTWSATDANGLGTSSATVEGQMISASGGHIDVDSLLAGTHTVTITQRDAAGNVSTKALTFTIRATPTGILAAINDIAARGFMTAAEKTTLVNAINAVISAPGNSGKNKMKTVISDIQSATSAQLTTAFQTLLLSWANDAYSRM